MGKVALETTQWDLLTKEQAHRYLCGEDFSILKFLAVGGGLRATSAFLLQLFWKNVFGVGPKHEDKRGRWSEAKSRPKGSPKQGLTLGISLILWLL
jgi:hypothetical protein